MLKLRIMMANGLIIMKPRNIFVVNVTKMGWGDKKMRQTEIFLQHQLKHYLILLQCQCQNHLPQLLKNDLEEDPQMRPTTWHQSSPDQDPTCLDWDQGEDCRLLLNPCQYCSHTSSLTKIRRLLSIMILMLLYQPESISDALGWFLLVSSFQK